MFARTNIQITLRWPFLGKSERGCGFALSNHGGAVKHGDQLEVPHHPPWAELLAHEDRGNVPMMVPEVPFGSIAVVDVEISAVHHHRNGPHIQVAEIWVNHCAPHEQVEVCAAAAVL